MTHARISARDRKQHAIEHFTVKTLTSSEILRPGRFTVVQFILSHYKRELLSLFYWSMVV